MRPGSVSWHVRIGLPEGFCFRGKDFATGSDETWVGLRVTPVSSSPRGGRNRSPYSACAQWCLGNSSVTRIWNQTRPWEKWRYHESKMRRCHRGPRGRGAERSGAEGCGARRRPGSWGDARGSRPRGVQEWCSPRVVGARPLSGSSGREAGTEGN